MRPTLAPVTRDWVEGHEAAMRKAAADAIAASNRWRQRDAELMVKFRTEKRNDYLIAQAKAADPELTDAYGAFSFFAAKVQLHSAALQGALASRTLLDGFDQSDPTGLRYDRGDDEPDSAPAVPPYVDGLSITGRPPRRPNSSPTGHVTDTRRAARSSSRPVGDKQGAAGAGAPAAPTGAVK